MTETEQTPEITRAHLAKTWVVRMVLIIVVLFAFGAWGLYDAVVKYPARGRLHAKGVQLEYLETADRTGMLYDTPVFDPTGELATLQGRDVLELSNFDRLKLEWLKSLAIPGLGMLKPEHTQMADPAAELQRLEEQFQKEAPPAGLSQFDIVLQWAIFVICWGLGAVMLVLFVLVKAKSYTWNPATKTLTMPGGVTISPADLDPADPADLTKWSKFVVFLQPREGHEKLRGPIKLDLFRYEPLEEWVKLLVKAADEKFEFPEEIKAREEAEAAAAAAEEDGDETGREKSAKHDEEG
ncbi:hypothetical protein MNBD_PLANCTO03-558 [hydrothermal vent metagenome]|uniref:Uncharacterized protein n=1 Tax=hydrothermal vent metagenome TaxID=652676 RepID=A0A3B1E7V5_9ZZZZ